MSDVELDALAFVKGLEAIALDRGEMDENVFAAFNFNEAEAFLCVKPLNCSCFHACKTSRKFKDLPISF
ncbi:hypothetical protein HMPREF9413_0679 [Paenibacillus sp. HGF7]|nr:hypothetical protein HMPREF9413_0679 [Paenibacillus sp. HGF7]